MKRYPLFIALFLIPILVVGLFGALPLHAAPPSGPAQPIAAPPAAPGAATTRADLLGIESSLEGIYTAVSPSVVNIQTVRQASDAAQNDLQNLFPFFNFGPDTPGTPQYARALGSGFVWDKQGHIITNNHVIDGADKISVTFSDGATVSGKVVGRDPESDLAVVQVDMPADRLLPVQLGDSTQAKVGQIAIAVGNPFGLQGSMTVGFVSALGRLLPVDQSSSSSNTAGYSIPDMIQIDTPINPGNSGGVVLDDRGQLIGVTSAIISPSRASAGIGFAIPSAIVKRVVPVLIKTGHFQHPWLGMAGTTLNPDLNKAMGLKSDQRGALIEDVIAGGPADKAGLKASSKAIQLDGEQIRIGGDVIVAMDGQPVNRFDDLVINLARSGEIGKSVTLTILRNGKDTQVKLVPAARPAQQPDVTNADNSSNNNDNNQPNQAAQPGAWLGLTGTSLSAQADRALNLPQGQQGVLIMSVVPDSPAAQAGLKVASRSTSNGSSRIAAGDVITAANGQPITSMQQLRGLVAGAQPGDVLHLTLLRGGQSVQVDVTLGNPPQANS